MGQEPEQVPWCVARVAEQEAACVDRASRVADRKYTREKVRNDVRNPGNGDTCLARDKRKEVASFRSLGVLIPVQTHGVILERLVGIRARDLTEDVRAA